MGRLAAAVDAAPTKRPGPRCGVARLRDALSEEDGSDLDDVLASARATSRIRRGLVEAAGALGLDPATIPAEYGLGKHRRGDCGCYR